MTGGLGPTQDDLTRRAIAQAAGLEIEIRDEALRHIESLFARRGREMPERNRLQAEFPIGSQIVPNPQGTAPGIDLVVRGDPEQKSRVFCLPGVPAEMRQMWHETVRERLLQQVGGQRRHSMTAVVKCFGLGESDMESRIPELIARDHIPRVGITVSQATISLRIAAHGESHAECEQQIAGVRRVLNDRIPEFIFGEGESCELQHVVRDLLVDRGETVCCLELGFNSLADTWLSAMECPDVYRGGLSLTDRSQIDNWLRVLNATESADAKDLSNTMLSAFDADWILIIDGYPSLSVSGDGPLPAAEIRLTVAGRKSPRPRSVSIQLAGHPDVLPSRIAKSGLDLLRKVLLR